VSKEAAQRAMREARYNERSTGSTTSPTRARPADAADLLAPAARVADVPGAEAYLLRCLAPLAEATGEPALLRRADGLLRGARVPEGCAWLLGADVYGALARAWERAGDPARAAEIAASLRTASVAAGWPGLADAVLN
jgi:hypothetical protein